MHTAVWNGTEMLIWGGRNNLNKMDSILFRYNPNTNSWSQIIGINSPSGRVGASAIFANNNIIIFGGGCLNGYCDDKTWRYNITTNTWHPIQNNNVSPTSRYLHSAIWTGSEMIIWGGSGIQNTTNTGMSLRYSSPTFGPRKTVFNYVFRKN